MGDKKNKVEAKGPGIIDDDKEGLGVLTSFFEEELFTAVDVVNPEQYANLPKPKIK